MRLAVELHGALIGTLTGDPRTFDFTPSGAAIERFGLNSTALSVAIPLSERPRRDHAERRRNWFRELLPEGDQYEYMLQQGGLRRGDTLGFLARYGRDVAGALQLWDLDDEQEPRTPETRELTASQIRALLEDPVTSPLANAPGTGKSSFSSPNCMARARPSSSMRSTGRVYRAASGSPRSMRRSKPSTAYRLW